MRSIMRLEENVAGANIALTHANLAEITQALPADAFQGERYPAFLASKPA
jgi:aryl-alcohol dehydrogenase-like predicted oxidoreductase